MFAYWVEEDHVLDCCSKGFKGHHSQELNFNFAQDAQ